MKINAGNWSKIGQNSGIYGNHFFCLLICFITLFAFKQNAGNWSKNGQKSYRQGHTLLKTVIYFMTINVSKINAGNRSRLHKNKKNNKKLCSHFFYVFFDFTASQSQPLFCKLYSPCITIWTFLKMSIFEILLPELIFNENLSLCYLF